jgi:hypothetical protein
VYRALGGNTEKKVVIPFPVPHVASIGSFPSELAIPDNGSLVPYTRGADETLYQLNKARVGRDGQDFACFINTGTIGCDLTHVVPYVWSKLNYTPASPLLRRDLQLPNTSFSSFRFYVPQRRAESIRAFPLIRLSPFVQQVLDPNDFLRNPENSDVNQ